MSSYTPPGQSPPVFDRKAMRVQRRSLRNQQRTMRYQQRAQRRRLQRRSIVGPLILLALGIVFLLAHLGDLSWSHSVRWYGLYWPTILIAAGLILFIEWVVDRSRKTGLATGRILGRGTIFLLVCLAFLGMTSRSIESGLVWGDHNFGSGYARWNHLFGDLHEASSSISHPIDPGSVLLIRNPHGDVTITGSSTDDQAHVSVLTQAYAWKNADGERKLRALQPTFSMANGVLSLDVNSVDGGQADLTIQVPRTVALTIQSDRGDVAISEISAPVTLSAKSGDVNLSGINNSITIHVNDDNADITLHSIRGPVSLQGNSGDIDISDVAGSLTLQGDFFGSTNIQHVAGAVHFTTSRTQFSVVRLDDEFSVNKDSLDASALLGPVLLRTEDKNITLNRVQGSVDVSNSNGWIHLTAAAPLNAILIKNQRGSVDLGIPGKSIFTANATTRNGDLEDDFGLTPSGSEDSHTLIGPVNGGGPPISISTTDGDITLRRSTVAPLSESPANPPLFARAPSNTAHRDRHPPAITSPHAID